MSEVDRAELSFVLCNISLAHLMVNLHLQRYMFVQMFDRFRPYFTVFVSGIPAMFAIPLMARLYRYPSVLVSLYTSLCFNFSILFNDI